MRWVTFFIFLVLAQHVDAAAHRQSIVQARGDQGSLRNVVEQVLKNLQQHNNNDDRSFLEVGTTVAVQDRVGSCLFRHFDQYTFDLSDPSETPTITTTAATQGECASVSAANTSAIGYQFIAPSTCHIIAKATPDFEANSAVCIKRGGCDGEGAEDTCVWYNLEDVSVEKHLFGTAYNSVELPHESACRLLCQQDVAFQCVAYSFVKSASPKLCKLFNTAHQVTQSSHSGLCLRGLAFASIPSSCWGSHQCTKDVVVDVPPSLGNPFVSISAETVPVDGGAMTEMVGRSQEGQVRFSGVTFAGDGRFHLAATTPIAPCPAVSNSIRVLDKTVHSFWRFQSDFEAEKGFWVLQVGRDCPNIILILGILTLVALFLVIRIALNIMSPKKIISSLVIGAIVGLFYREFVHGWNHWECMAAITTLASAEAMDRLLTPTPAPNSTTT